MSKVNLEGIDVNDGIMIAFRDYKQGKLLENANFKIRHSLHYPEIYAEKLTDEVKHQMIQKLTSDMVHMHFNTVKEFNDPTTGERIYDLELMVFPMEHFKHLVDYVIRQLPQTSIDKIKQGK